MEPTVISLFSGAGGLDLGLELAGFKTRACVELEHYAALALRQNKDLEHKLPGGAAYLADAQIIEADIQRQTGRGLLRSARLKRGEAALLAGGPPCVTFSVAGRREGLTAATGMLFRDYVRLLRATRPRGLIFENVKGLLSARGSDGVTGSAFTEICEAIASEGYALTWRVINAADYGVPQQRERVIILGLRGSKPPIFPEPTHRDASKDLQTTRTPWTTVRDAIGDLPPAAPPGEESVIPNHVSRRHGPSVIRSFLGTPPGKRNARYKRDKLKWDRPSKVIRAQGKPKPDGSGQKNSSHQPLHPEEPRQLTPRECARIQGFPDWYWLPPHFVNGYRVVGDAVPPKLAEILGRGMLTELGLATKTLAA